MHYLQATSGQMEPLMCPAPFLQILAVSNNNRLSSLNCISCVLTVLPGRADSQSSDDEPTPASRRLKKITEALDSDLDDLMYRTATQLAVAMAEAYPAVFNNAFVEVSPV